MAHSPGKGHRLGIGIIAAEGGMVRTEILHGGFGLLMQRVVPQGQTAHLIGGDLPGHLVDLLHQLIAEAFQLLYRAVAQLVSGSFCESVPSVVDGGGEAQHQKDGGNGGQQGEKQPRCQPFAGFRSADKQKGDGDEKSHAAEDQYRKDKLIHRKGEGRHQPSDGAWENREHRRGVPLGKAQVPTGQPH